MSEQTEMKMAEENVASLEQRVEQAEKSDAQKAAEEIQKEMTVAANALAEATGTKVCILFWSDELTQAGSFASENLSPLEERGLIALAQR